MSAWVQGHSRWMIGFAVLALVAMVAVGYFAGAQIASNTNHSLQVAIDAEQTALAAQTRLSRSERAALYGECHQRNLGRITTNRNNYASFKLWQSALSLLQFNADQPAQPGTKPNPRATVLFDAFLTAMHEQVNTLSWTPLSNCEQATDMPSTFQPPAAVQFSQQLPPLSAFTLGPNE